MASFFSHGFASGGGSSKKGKKRSEDEEEGVWIQVVDGRGQVNWQHSVTGAYWPTFHPAPVQHIVGGPYAVQPMVQPVYQAANSWVGANVVPVSPMSVGAVMNGKKKKKEKGGFWDSCRDADGVRCYKHSRTKEITYFDPYV